MLGKTKYNKPSYLFKEKNKIWTANYLIARYQEPIIKESRISAYV